jgi:hypothetical protein
VNAVKCAFNVEGHQGKYFPLSPRLIDLLDKYIQCLLRRPPQPSSEVVTRKEAVRLRDEGQPGSNSCLEPFADCRKE